MYLVYRYTACKAFRQLLQELGDFAGQREVVAENLQSNVVREVHLLAKELREERKVLLSTGSRQEHFTLDLTLKI